MTAVAEHAAWTPEAIRALPPTVDLPTAGSLFGLSRWQSYEALARGNFPVGVIRIGRRIIVPTAPCLQLLGLDSPQQARSDAGQQVAASGA